ncbi:MAG: sensor histidine kinase, partial [Caldilinea sp.]
GKLIVVVEDDGQGFDPKVAPAQGHLGLIGMQERVAQLDGTLTIESTPGAGATLVVEAPL